MGPKKKVALSELEQKWKDNCLPNERLYSLIQIGSFGDQIEWLKFFALACSALAGVSVLTRIQDSQVLLIRRTKNNGFL